MKHILINLTIMVFVAMVLLTHFKVNLGTGTAILSFPAQICAGLVYSSSLQCLLA